MKYILNTLKSFLFLTLLVSSLAFATGASGTDPNLAATTDGAGFRAPTGDCGSCVGEAYIDSSKNKAAIPGKGKPGSLPGDGDVTN